VSLCDIAAGNAAALGVLGALAARHTTGAGATLSVSMFDATVDWTAPTLGLYLATGVEPQPAGLHHLHVAPYGPFRCGDGRVVFVVAQQDREWQELCTRVFRRPDLAADQRFVLMAGRMQHREALHACIESVLAAAPAAEWEARLVAAGLATARLRGVADVAAHPIVQEQGLLQTVHTASGTAQVPRQPIRSNAGAMGGGPAIPCVGEHTATWLRRLGYTAAERRTLIASGAAAAA
jgi:crotonobetainyl-CoA:carnitine CoA-transferase CaiB-like acyl-CoA transferase